MASRADQLLSPHRRNGPVDNATPGSVRATPAHARPFSVQTRELLLEIGRSPVGVGLGAGATVTILAALVGVSLNLAVALGLSTAITVGLVTGALYRVERQVRNVGDAVALSSHADASRPAFGTWAIEPDIAQLIVQEVEGKHTVVECGSGVTTLVIAERLRSRGTGRLYTLEHDPMFAKKMKARLDADGLGDWVEFIDAPLVNQTFCSRRVNWYSEPAITPRLPAEIDLLVVDGPPALTPWARWPAIEVLHERLAADAVVLVDDGRRRSERRTVFRWQAEHPELVLYWHDTVKGTWRLVNEGRAQREGRLCSAAREMLRRLDPCPRGFGRWPVRR
jgi:hypothetical protein